MAASASRGWEEMPLFAPRRFSIRANAGVTYDTEHIHVAADTGIDLMVRVGGNDPTNTGANMCATGVTCAVRSPAYAWLTHASFFYSFGLGPGYIEPGLRAWLVYAGVPWYGNNNDDSGAQFVLEPQVDARYALNEAKSLWLKGLIGFIAPVPGPIGGLGPQGSKVYGVRVRAEFMF
jgi:hypothetical protein